MKENIIDILKHIDLQSQAIYDDKKNQENYT